MRKIKTKPLRLNDPSGPDTNSDKTGTDTNADATERGKDAKARKNKFDKPKREINPDKTGLATRVERLSAREKESEKTLLNP